MEDEILFTEKQHFKQWWLWIILLGVNGLLVLGVFKQVIGGQQFGNKPMSNIALLSTAVLTLFLTILCINFQLETQIKKDGIYVKFFPLHLSFRKYTWDNISKAFVRKYNPIGEYGG